MDDSLEKMIVEIKRKLEDRFYGKYRGQVKQIDEKTGAIKAKVPEVYGDKLLSPWATPAVPFAGNQHGLLLLPEEDDGVWIEFEAGDFSRPVWSGAWWADNEIPDSAGKTKRALITTKGLKLVLDDDAKEIHLVHPGGAEIILSDQAITLQIGSTKLELSSTGVKVNDGAWEIK